MNKRRPMGRRESQRDFRRKSRVHIKNTPSFNPMVMRGGIRA